MRKAFICAALVLVAACDRLPQLPQQRGASGPGPELSNPAPEIDPGRTFEPVNDTTRGATGSLNVIVASTLPDAASADRGDTAMIETLTLRGANGAIVQAQLTGSVEPSATVQGNTLRSLMGLDVDAAQVLVYRITNATGRSLCGDAAASAIAVFDPETAGASRYSILPLAGGAPGESGARACPALNYRQA
ncbi:MAG: hypothetical protein ABW199_08355 [Caulobacterales bacterium]